MNILFLTMTPISSINENTLYANLISKFLEHNHYIDLVTPIKNSNRITYIEEKSTYRIIHIKIGSQDTHNLIKKGISTINIEPQYKATVKKYCSDKKYDLVLYSTPPITLCSTISYIKKRDNAKSYLMLKDIFPQNAVDINMLSKKGPKASIYRYFRRKESNLYKLSDYIGCMSPANVNYLLKHNPSINPNKVMLLPNSVNINKTITKINKEKIRKEFNLPLNKKIFIYGGNLGKPQGIPFIIKCLEANKNLNDRFFIICGSGTERHIIKEYIEKDKPKNIVLFDRLEKSKYENLVSSCDVGLIFLDHRFTIPNFPSRLLSLMQRKIPVFACTDTSTDIGKIITNNKFGWWCESNNEKTFRFICDDICKLKNNDLEKLGNNGYDFLKKNYTTDINYSTIMDAISN